jgi:hypothetical protein
VQIHELSFWADIARKARYSELSLTAAQSRRDPPHLESPC